ncbi:hypothetical protein F01_140036 [Burkholderia cenocepacia]|nr:hypothetical protein F01_140036 [Burkholderia cenocepacia]
MVRRGRGRIPEGVRRGLRGSRAASRLLPDARRRHLQEGAERRVRAQPDRPLDGRRAAAGAAAVGIRAVGAGARSRDRRARQARCGVRRGPARAGAPLPPGPRQRAARRRRHRRLGRHRDDGPARIPADPAGRGREGRRHGRVRHLAPVPDVRQVAPGAGARSAIPRDGSRRNVLLTHAAGDAAQPLARGGRHARFNLPEYTALSSSGPVVAVMHGATGPSTLLHWRKPWPRRRSCS